MRHEFPIQIDLLEARQLMSGEAANCIDREMGFPQAAVEMPMTRSDEARGLARRVSGKLRSSDGSSAGAYADFFTLRARRSGLATIAMRSAAVDSFLIIQDGTSDAEIVRDNDSGGGSDAQARFRVRKGRSYTIVATTAFANDTGKYRLQWSKHFNGASQLPPRDINVPRDNDEVGGDTGGGGSIWSDDAGGGDVTGGGGGGTDDDIIVDPSPSSNIPFSGAYGIQITAGGTYGEDSLLGAYLIKGLVGRTGLIFINPTLDSANFTNASNAREVGFYLSDNIFSRTPGLGSGGDTHFATNTTLHRQLGISHASTLFDGAVDVTPDRRDIAYVALNESQRRIVADVDQLSLGSTGQRNFFIKSDGSLLTVSGPLPITGGRIEITFSPDGSSISGTAFFTGIDNAGFSFGNAAFAVQFRGERVR